LSEKEQLCLLFNLTWLDLKCWYTLWLMKIRETS